jgi:hypothetical protein
MSKDYAILAIGLGEVAALIGIIIAFVGVFSEHTRERAAMVGMASACALIILVKVGHVILH